MGNNDVKKFFSLLFSGCPNFSSAGIDIWILTAGTAYCHYKRQFSYGFDVSSLTCDIWCVRDKELSMFKTVSDSHQRRPDKDLDGRDHNFLE